MQPACARARSPACQLIGWNPHPKYMRASDVEAEVLNLVEPANVHIVEMHVRLQPCDPLVFNPEVGTVGFRLAPHRPRCLAAQQVVLDDSQYVQTCQQLQN